MDLNGGDLLEGLYLIFQRFCIDFYHLGAAGQNLHFEVLQLLGKLLGLQKIEN